MSDDPFALLGLPPRPGLSDEEVRAAWRRVAAATHPDRADGGDPARFGAAAAAYVLLRTPFERGEALADLSAGPPRHRIRRPGPHGTHRAGAGRGSGHRGSAYRGSGHRASAYRGSAHWASVLQAWARQAWATRPGTVPAGAAVLGLGRGLTLRVASAAVVAAATVAAVGLTPATIGLLAGALTVSCWALWRRGGWGR